MPPASKFVAVVLPKYAKIALLGFNVSTLSNDRRPVRRYTDHSRPRANDMNNSGSHANGPSMSWTRGTCGACLSHSEVCQRSPMGQLQKIQNPKGQLSRRGLSVAFPIDAPRNSDVHVYGHGRNSANSCEATRQNMSF